MLLQQIESINGILHNLEGSTRERARRDRDDLIIQLHNITRFHWRYNSRLTILDSNRNSHHEPIVFRNPNGSIARDDDLLMGEHILVMAAGDSYNENDIENNPGFVRLDGKDVAWMPIMSNQDFLLLQFQTGDIHLISNSYGIRALTSGYKII